MPLFQNAVLNKYLSGVDENKVNEAWEIFTAYFHNVEVQQNIREAKEESYQEGFLDDLFVKILGYTKSPAPNYNLVVEQKNLNDSKKADGALLDGEKVRGVIELKGTETTDLSKVETQAFGYKNKQPDALYVIISNFEKLRFYIDNAVDFLEFNLFTLTKEEFKLLWLCLGYSNFAKGLPKKIKDASLTEEENVTKKLYKDYSDFKNAVFESIKKHNPEYDKLLLFKKTQKLLDRFLFIFFAEDRLLLPPNSIREIIKQWMDLRDKYDEYVPLYERFKKYFGYMNEGYKGKNHEIFAYNGGLFVEDEVLDNLKIDDELLYKHTMQLSNYDFDSEVDVNILGHIFEHSLNEIEEITAELEGQKVDTSKTRRKKDGVFYTPKYITKYIVENTLGKLCEEQKAELKIEDEDYRPNRQKKTKKELLGKLDKYREWLLELTICDPACGSGAFLNQALEFLIEEHTYVDELQAKLLDQPLVIPDIENQILENNLFGVDINEESVEIAKLSLWLRTAQKGRKLTSLNNHIKCGNSLIDNPEVAGDKAFKWEKEFPAVFANGGFDVVIGNPPYVRVEFISGEEVKYYKSTYKSATGKFDLSSLFIESSVRILKDKGVYSVITSYQFIHTNSGIGLRKFLVENAKTIIRKFSSESQVFEGATTYAAIIILEKGNTDKLLIDEVSNKQNQISVIKSLKITNNNFTSKKVILADTSVYDKIISLPDVKTGSDIGTAKTGVVTSADKVFYVNKETIENEGLESNLLYPIIGPENLYPWLIQSPSIYCIYPYEEVDGKTELISFSTLENDYPNISKYLIKNRKILENRSQGRKDYSESDNWYQLNRPREKWIYDSKKIIYPGTTNRPKYAFDKDRQLFRNARTYAFLLSNASEQDYLAIITILNSSLSQYLSKLKCPPKANGYYEMSTSFLENFPFLFPTGKLKTIFIEQSKKQTNLVSSLMDFKLKFNHLVLSKFDIDKLSRKLESWHELTFKEFLKELKKKKVELTLNKEAEWMDYFNQQKAEAENLKSQIAQTDKEIDEMVYELYGLNEEEVKVIENISK